MGVDHYENFPVASILLPGRLRHPVQTIYRFARAADDIADEGDHPAQARLDGLNRFRVQLDAIAQGRPPADPHFAALAEVIEEYGLPLPLFHDLLDAFSQDVTRTRYGDFVTLGDYCRRSANPVGRLLLHLFGATAHDLLLRSDQICTSLQLINFLQDVEADYDRGRIYIPVDEMIRYGVPESQIARKQLSDGWTALMDFQIQRARDMMLAGAPLGRALPGRIGLELRLIVAGGLRILEKLQAVRGDVFRHRPVLTTFDWARMLWRAAIFTPSQT